MKVVLVFASLAASTSVLAPTIACAAEREQLSSSVAYDDLNLASAKGQKAFERRVALAVRSMCADDGVRGLSRRNQVKECAADARETAEREARLAITAAQGTRLAARD